MGLSGKDSRVFYIPLDCPVKLDGTTPSGDRLGLYEQVTRIEITPSVSQRKYAHDKSFGTQDVCSGIKSWDETMKLLKAGWRQGKLELGGAGWRRNPATGIWHGPGDLFAV